MQIDGEYIKIAAYKKDNQCCYISYCFPSEYGRDCAIQLARAIILGSVHNHINKVLVTREYNSHVEEQIYEAVSGVA